MRRFVAATVLTALSFTTVAAAGDGEVPAPQATDVAGDANAINGQGFGDIVPVPNNQATPVDMAFADLVGIRIDTYTDEGDPDGIKIAVLTSQAPAAIQPQVIYRVLTNVGGCDSQFSFEAGGGGEPTFVWRQLSACSPPEPDPALGYQSFTNEQWTVEILDGDVKGLEVTIPFTSLDERQAKFIAVGEEFFPLDAHSRTVFPGGPSPASATVPEVDNLHDPEFDGYEIGQDS